MKIKIYSGLSLRRDQVHRMLPSAEFATPIKRGDLQFDIRAGIQVIGIIDGLFYRNLSVSPTEILDALRFGIKIFGSSSMGALRAVELEDYGMIGVGDVFQHIRNCEYFADDLLGQIFLEDQLSSKNLAGIDLYLGLKIAMNKKLITKSSFKKILECYQRSHFTERNLRWLMGRIDSLKIPAMEKTRSLQVLGSLQSLKTRDAKNLVRSIAELDRDRATNQIVNEPLLGYHFPTKRMVAKE